MAKKFISDLFDLHIGGHADINFVDVDVFTDTELFIDPCLIEISDDAFCRNAQRTIDNFFDKLYANYKASCESPEIDALLQHLGERNEARMGYGNGRNGKGKTPQGMKDILADMHNLIRKGIHIESPIDLPLLLQGFAEDRMSDMLINILFKELSEFTLQQCEQHNIQTEPLTAKRYYWDIATGTWQLYTGQCLKINGRIIIMIPKHIVRKGYYYNTRQYFNSMIAVRIQADQMENVDGKMVAPTKKDIFQEELQLHGSLIQAARIHTEHYPAYLDKYHRNMAQAYAERGMTDDELDSFIYSNPAEIA